MDLISHLRSFVAVAETGSFTVGAATVGVPQPVVSRRIMALERSLGDALFVRSARRVRITEFGQRLLPHAVDLVARTDRLLDLAATQRDRTLRIGLPPDADVRPLAAAGVALRELGFALDVVTAGPDERAEGVAGGTLHAALVGSPYDAADVAVPLGAAQPDSPGPGRFHLDELRRRRADGDRPLRRLYLDPEDGLPELRRRVDELAARAGLAPVQVEQSDSVAGALIGVHAGDGVLLCSRGYAARHRLGWRPVRALYRCYAIRIAVPAPWQDTAATVRSTLAPHLVESVGGHPPGELDPPAGSRSLAGAGR